MGLDFLRAQTVFFEQKRDEAHQGELSFADILTRIREDVVIHNFNCMYENTDLILSPNDAIIGRAYSDAEVRIQVRGGYVGHVLPGDAELLTSLMKKNGCHGFISLRLVTPPGIDNVFRVTSKKPFYRN